ncbi:crosslink repair DNA glycosylase YcaQ family protein [Actinoplanes sp. NPDC023936]|uniref:DNA glycosylase AlkZ-like family protein n=1 Tax=Actinoplanes sp. NPDC023936 TaxID=3154910 RepID=UPI003400BF71
MINVDRAQVMAYRVTALGLAERVDVRAADLPVLDLGIQQYTPDSAQVALTARSSAEPADDRLAPVWAARGAPHLHRRSDLAALTSQLWPLTDADAATRINSAQIPDAGALGMRAFTVTAEAFREVVTGPIARGAASTEVSKRVPGELTYQCRGCGARHIAGNVWQQAGLAGGVEVLSRGKDALLGPLPDAPALPGANAGIDRLIATYLRFLGPAGPGEVAKYLGSSPAQIRKVWPSAGLTEVHIDGRKAWLPDTEVPALQSARTAPGVRWLPGMDPLLQARDRDVLIPERAAQKEVWRSLGNPGVLLVDSEIAGVWRARLVGRKRVDLTVTAFNGLSAARRKQADQEAAQVARARGVPEATVTYE